MVAAEVVAVMLRAGLFVLAWTLHTVTAGAQAVPGAEIGAGLFPLALLTVAAAIWAVVDGRRGIPLGRLLVRWAVVAVLVALYVPIFTFIRAGGPTVSALYADVIVISPLIAGVLYAPAAIGGAAGSIQAAKRRRPPPPHRHPL